MYAYLFVPQVDVMSEISEAISQKILSSHTRSFKLSEQEIKDEAINQWFERL